MKIFSKRLSYKINSAIIITFILIAVIFSVIQLPFQKRRLNTVTGKIKVLLQTLVERDFDPLSNEIFERRIRAVKSRLRQMRGVEGILNITVFNEEGKILAYDGNDSGAVRLSEAMKKHSREGIVIQRIHWRDQPVIYYLQEIRVIGEIIGYIQIHYSLEDVEKEQNLSILIFASLLCSILFVMLLLLNIMLRKSIISPITLLRDVMYQMRSGDLGEQVHIFSQDEIGDLATSFNKMSKDLAESYRAIEEKNLELQRLDMLKDQFLANTSHELRTPLNGIIGIADSLIDGACEKLGDNTIHNFRTPDIKPLNA